MLSMNTMTHIFDYDESYYKSHYGYLWDDAYYRRLTRYYKRFWFAGVSAETKLVFEYGCGLGVNIAWSPQAHGYDISPQARAFARSKGICVYDSMAEVAAEAFPIVLSSHVLEHVDDPLAALSEMRRVLAPGGMLILAVPKEKHGNSSFEADGDAHLYSWTFRTINNLLLRGGFKILENRMVWGPTGLKKLASLESLLGEGTYLDLAHFFGRLRDNLPTLKVLARK
jgi:SAM-dependent methyltransferase